jgi:hypothetical protein
VPPSLSASVAQMGSIHQDDPFLWDTETLSKEICSQNAPWIKYPAALAAKLAENDIDGRTLLSYEYLLSRAELMECLDLTTARSKADLAETIINFRARSKAFRSWKKTFLKTQAMLLSDDEQHDVKTELSHMPPMKRSLDPTLAPKAHSSSPEYEPPETVEVPLLNDQITNGFGGALLEPDGDYSMQLDGDANFTTRFDSANGVSSITPQPPSHTSTDVQANGKESYKRRRLEPMNLSTKPLADPSSPEYSYLGSGRLLRRDILSSIGTPDYPRVSIFSAILGNKLR